MMNLTQSPLGGIYSTMKLKTTKKGKMEFLAYSAMVVFSATGL